MDKMDTWQILWGINTLLLALFAYIHKMVRDDIKELKEDLDKRTLVITCDRLHAELEKSCGRRHEALDDNCDKIHSAIITACETNHNRLAKDAHVHGNLGQSGEVIQR
jgi:hypothetical protein